MMVRGNARLLFLAFPDKSSADYELCSIRYSFSGSSHLSLKSFLSCKQNTFFLLFSEIAPLEPLWIGITPFPIPCAFLNHTRSPCCDQKMLIKAEAYYFIRSHQTTILSSKFLIIVISRDSAIFFHFCQLFYTLYSPLAISSRNFC